MNDSFNNDQTKQTLTGVKEIVGAGFIGVALYLAYWVFTAVMQLWNTPESVGILRYAEQLTLKIDPSEPMFGDFLGQFSVIINIVISIAVLSVVTSLIRIFVVSGLVLLFPQLRVKGSLLETISKS